MISVRPQILFIVLPLLFFGSGIEGQEALRIAAVVNDEVVSDHDLSERLSLVISSSQLEDSPETRQRLSPQVLRGLIDDRLKLQEAKRQGISVSDADMQGAFSQLERQNNLPPGDLDRFLAQIGIKKSALVDQIETEIAWARVVARKVRSEIDISDEEIDEKLAEIEANKGKPEYWLSEIFLSVDNPRDEKEIRQLADRLVQQLASGAAFEALATNFSQGATAATGGNLGWNTSDQLEEELVAAIAKMRPGQVSAPIRTLAGYHVLYLRSSRTAAGVVSPDEEVSLRQLFVPLSDGAPETEVRQQLELAESHGQRAKSCADMEVIGKELGTPMSGDLGWVKIADLPGQVQGAIQDLPLNQATKALRTPGGFIVLMICDRRGGKSNAAVRAEIERAILDQRAEVVARRYLRDLRRAAFVEIRQ